MILLRLRKYKNELDHNMYMKLGLFLDYLDFIGSLLKKIQNCISLNQFNQEK